MYKSIVLTASCFFGLNAFATEIPQLPSSMPMESEATLLHSYYTVMRYIYGNDFSGQMKKGLPVTALLYR